MALRYTPNITSQAEVHKSVISTSAAGHRNSVFNEDPATQAIFKLQLAAKTAERQTNEIARDQFSSLRDLKAPTITATMGRS